MSIVLGLDDYGRVFEGIDKYGAHLVWPLPVMTPAKFAHSADEKFEAATEKNPIYFREDSFDPVSRIRRGRFYEYAGNTSSWSVMPNANIYVSSYGSDSTGMTKLTLASYRPYRPNSDSSKSIAILGSGSAYSLWTIIGVETIGTSEELVTLKARQSMGVLPEINWSVIPENVQGPIRDKIEKLVDDYQRAGAESAVDRAREAATAILSGYLVRQGFEEASGKDLGDLVELLVNNSRKNERRIVACAAEIPQRFHSRSKHAEEQKLKGKIRPLRIQDAELAVQCVGVMLCDLGWAEWR